MATPAVPLLYQAQMAGFRRFTVAEYHRLIQMGILTEDDNLELLEGCLVHKMTKNPPHECVLQQGIIMFVHLLPTGWGLRVQSPITLPDSEPEPDFAIVRGGPSTYRTHHPTPADVGCVIEVADSSLPGDRNDKGRIYARAGIVAYWIVNLVDYQIEVYTLPSGPVVAPGFAQRTDYRVGDTIPLFLPGAAPVQVPAQDLLP